MSAPVETVSDLFSDEILSEPNPFYSETIPHTPVVYVPSRKIYAVLSYDLVLQVADDHVNFSSQFGELLKGLGATDPDIMAVLSEGWPLTDSLISNDPPLHGRFRRLVSRAFTMPRVAAMEAEIRNTAQELVSAIEPEGRCDFVTNFAIPLPILVISRLLGSGEVPVQTVKMWSDAFVHLFGGKASREVQLASAHLIVAFQRHFIAKIAERRADRTIEDIIASLVHARTEDDEPLSDAEILSVIQALLIAGNETTTSTLAEGMKLFIEHPEQVEKVLRNPKLLGNMVEEILRLTSPAAGLWRIAAADTQLGEVAIPKGALLNLRFAAANRDPAHFPKPNQFDVERPNAKTHLAFGRGIHMCIGNMLARKELAIGFEELLTRLTSFRITDPAALTYPPNMVTRGLSALPISFRRQLEHADAL
jgi:cytochrome P450